MDPVRLSISRPVGVTVGVLLVVMFGLIGLTFIPIQLTPTVDRPQITVTTSWPGRSPQEIVDEITEPQEERLKGVENLETMRSTSREGAAEVTLELALGADVGRALQEVNDALRQVSSYPADVDEPVVKAAEGASENAIAWIIIDLPPAGWERHPGFDVSTLYDALDKEVKPFLERIDGVAEINIYGGREREVHLLLDPAALAARGLSHGDLVVALRAENRNISAGSITEGKRDYRVRVLGKLTRTDEVLDTVIAYREGQPVRVRDVAAVEIDYARPRGFVRSLGAPSVAMNCIRQTGANVMDVMAELRARLSQVRSEILPNLAGEVGPDLRLRQVYDETVYITSAIGLVTQNLWVGGAIAGLILLLFLRSLIATGVAALAIPLAVMGTFLVLLALGRSLNVISLAGLAFAVGMVVDNAIVVLENIYRHRELGASARVAAYRGAREVWGAILASTLTTVAVFVPMLTLADEAGQLFRDISIAIVASVSLSLLVSITVIPAASSRWLGGARAESGRKRRAGRAGVFGWLLERFIAWLDRTMRGWRARVVRPLVILGMTAVSLAGAWWLAPPLDYLPAGNRNLVFGGLLIPPGYSLDQQARIAERIEAQIQPYAEVDIDDPQAMAALAPIPRRDAPDAPFAPVPMENFFIGAFRGGMFVGATSQDPTVVLPVGTLLTNAMNTVPDAFGGARQSSIFGRGAGGGGTIDLEISGPRLDRVEAAANAMFMSAARRFGYGSVRPDPANFNLSQPEWRLTLNEAGRELGLRAEDVGLAVRGLVDGVLAGEFELAGEPVDLVVLPLGGRLGYKEQLLGTPIATPGGRTVPLASVVDVVPALAPQEIQRIEELPSVTVRVSPPEGEALEAVMQQLESEVVGPARQAGLIDRTMRVRLEGTAARLDQVKAALLGGGGGGDVEAGEGVVSWLGRTARQLLNARFIWALAVTYLLMCALFESFLYPFVIMFSVPLAVVGGFAGLRLVHEITLANPTIAPQKLDVLTMLGFAILIGVVVNNAILVVHQALRLMRGETVDGAEADGAEGGDAGAPAPLAPAEAIAEAVRTRVRPIFMSTLTSVGGMLPLVLFPGAGSEMYRGLGSVVVGGLLVSTVFTLVLVPLLFSLVVDVRGRLARAAV
jgi:HAE1 family hydrophobic/amphiphilic exporter-1